MCFKIIKSSVNRFDLNRHFLSNWLFFSQSLIIFFPHTHTTDTQSTVIPKNFRSFHSLLFFISFVVAPNPLVLRSFCKSSHTFKLTYHPPPPLLSLYLFLYGPGILLYIPSPSFSSHSYIYNNMLLWQFSIHCEAINVNCHLKWRWCLQWWLFSSFCTCPLLLLYE